MFYVNLPGYNPSCIQVVCSRPPVTGPFMTHLTGPCTAAFEKKIDEIGIYR